MSVSVTNLDFAYGDHLIFDQLNWSASNSRTLIRGPSGCGKTTLLRLLCRLLKGQSGRVETPQGAAVLVLQQDSLLPWLTGFDNLTMFVDKELITSHPLFPLLESLVNKRAYQLSYGQRRLIELVRAFAFRPALLCLDEPLNFLDGGLRQKIDTYLSHEYVRQDDNTRHLVITSHYESDFADKSFDSYRFNVTPPHSGFTKINHG